MTKPMSTPPIIQLSDATMKALEKYGTNFNRDDWVTISSSKIPDDAKPKQISKAPPPITGISGRGSSYHKPPAIPTADYETWLKADLWTLERGILLLLGAERIPYGEYGEREFYKAYQDDFNKIWAIAESSLKTGVLKKIGKGYPRLFDDVLPADFIAWAMIKGYSIPVELEAFESGVQPETVGDDGAGSQTDAPPKQSASKTKDNEAPKPWLISDPRDPEPKYPWYTPARYFARQLVIDDSTLLTKRSLVARKVTDSLDKVGIKNRSKKKFDPGTILKAFTNVTLG